MSCIRDCNNINCNGKTCWNEYWQAKKSENLQYCLNTGPRNIWNDVRNTIWNALGSENLEKLSIRSDVSKERLLHLDKNPEDATLKEITMILFACDKTIEGISFGNLATGFDFYE